MAQLRAKSGRPRRGLARWGGLVLALPAALGAVMVLQVLAARWIDPPFTLTMVEAVLDERDESGRWDPPRRRSLPAAALTAPIARMVVSAEDGRFFLHHGFDIEGICDAAAHNRRPGAKLRGASTISQQVARNVFLWQRRSWLRKGLEAVYTVLLELLLPKERILELYLQVAQTGPLDFGVEQAARRHFGKSAHQLNEDEAARLASVFPAPRRRSPVDSGAAGRAAKIVGRRAPMASDPGFAQVAAKADVHGRGLDRCARLLRTGR